MCLVYKVAIITTSNMAYDQRLTKVMATMADLPIELSYMDRGGKNSQKPYFSSGVLFYLEWNIRLLIYLLRQKPNGVYAADIDTSLAVIFCKLFGQRINFVLDLHELYTDTPELIHSPIKRRIWALVERWAFGKADALITVNSSLRNIFFNRYHRDVQVVANVPMFNVLSEVECCSSRNMNVLYYQGALNAGRGLECAIETMIQLPDWKLWIVGSGDLDQELRELVKELGLASRVVFYGKRLPSELPELARQATIGLNLLQAASPNYYYSLANKFFDYMQVGLPSINMNFPEYNHVLQKHKTGLVVDDLNPEKLKEAVLQITSNKSEYRDYVIRSLEAASVYTWESEAVKLDHLLRQQFLG